MIFQQEQQHVSGVVIVGRLYNRMPHNICMDGQRSTDSDNTLINTNGLRQNNVSLRRQTPPLLLPGSFKQRRKDRRDDHALSTTPPRSLLKKLRRSERNKHRYRRRDEHRDDHRSDHDLTMIDIVNDAEESPKLTKRSKVAKAKKVRMRFEQEQQRHEEQLQELQEQAVATITAAAIAEERFYNHKRNTSMTSQQTQDILDMMELESNSSFEYNDIAYNDIDIENDNDNDNDNTNNCFLTHLLPFFQSLKDKFDDQLLKSNP